MIDMIVDDIGFPNELKMAEDIINIPQVPSPGIFEGSATPAAFGNEYGPIQFQFLYMA